MARLEEMDKQTRIAFKTFRDRTARERELLIKEVLDRCRNRVRVDAAT
jgi:hypothetical protein